MRRAQSFFFTLILIAVGSGVARAQAPASDVCPARGI